MDLFEFESTRVLQILFKDGVLDAHLDGERKPIVANEISDLIPFVMNLDGITFASFIVGTKTGGIALGGTIHFNNLGETFYEFVDRVTNGLV